MIRVTAQRTAGSGLTHRLELRGHRLTADEPAERGGADQGPTPLELLGASLAACTAVTIEMYAQRKGWDLGALAVEVAYEAPERGAPTRMQLRMRLPSDLSEEQVRRLQTIAAKCPVHRILEGEVTIEDRIELVAPSAVRG